jgi:fatty acid desaturase
MRTILRGLQLNNSSLHWEENNMIKKRNMLGQIGLVIITFGIYAIYWFYKISEEMKFVGKDAEASPGLWTVLLFIPIANIWSYYKFSELFEKISADNFNKWLLFVLWLVFVPAVWFIVQSEMNKKADQTPAISV